jgi:hypothetical protein
MSNIQTSTNRLQPLIGQFQNLIQDQHTSFTPSVTKGTLANAPSLPLNLPPPRPKSPIPQEKMMVQQEVEVGDEVDFETEDDTSEMDEDTLCAVQFFDDVDAYLGVQENEEISDEDGIDEEGEGVELDSDPTVSEEIEVADTNSSDTIKGDDYEIDDDDSELTGDTKKIADFFADVDEFLGVDDEEDDTAFDEYLRGDGWIDHSKIDYEALDQVVSTLEQIDAEELGIDTDVGNELKLDATADEIANVLGQIDAEHGTEFDRPISPFSEDRYDTDAWSRPPEPSAPPLHDLPGIETDNFLEDLGTAPPMGRLSLQEFLLTEQGNISLMPESKEPSKASGLEKFGRNIATKFKAFGNMVKSGVNRLKEKMHHLAETRRELKLQREMNTGKIGGEKMDRLDEKLAGGPPKLGLQTPGALVIFAVKSEIGILHHPTQRGELLSHISNEMSGFLKDVRAQMMDPVLNQAKLPMSKCIECAVKEMLSKAPLDELQALNIDTLMEIAGSFAITNQNNKAIFAQVLYSELERFGDLSDGDAVVKQQNKLLDEVAATRSGGTSKYDKPDTKVELADLVSGPPHEISNHLTSLLERWNNEATSNETNPHQLNPTEYRQVALLRLFQKNEASKLRGLDPQKAESLMKVFLKQGQLEKAKAMSEILDLIEQSATPEGANEMFKDLALNEMRKASNGKIFLRSTTDEGTSAVKKLMNVSGASQIEGHILELVRELNNNPRIQDLNRRFVELGKPRFSDQRLPNDLGMELGALALELMQGIYKSPIPKEVTSLLSELAGTLPQNDQTDSFKHKLYTDQLVLKIASPMLALNGNPVIHMASDLINVIANGIRPPYDKYKEAGTLVLEKFGQPILELQERMLTNAGLPPSAKLKWPTKLD